ncbi:MAG: tRNA pseudouridine(55) synthase TruB [Fimbriimonadaceae bacterium]|nr:tRNA pseudouridine(55) synthase TruB [Fimbriimonadaceae bacterium]
MLGILLIDKPQGLTSHDVVNDIRRRLGLRRVGHAGSLDPMATGALVVAVGPATRFLQYLPLEPKEYVAEVTFGAETDTQDALGEVVREDEVPADLDARITASLPALIGPVQQLPPMYSAIKKQGKPLYAYARQGQEVERTPRTVYIEAFEEVGRENNTRTYRVVCSGGTYVRTLAHDLGQFVGCGAHLSALRRTRVGRYEVRDATPLEVISPEHLIPLRAALPPMPLVKMDTNRTNLIREGQSVSGGYSGREAFVALIEPSGEVFSVARVLGNRLQPECVIPAEALERAAL